MKSLVIKRSIVVGGHKTSVSLEDAFWSGLKEIAARRVTTPSELVSEVDKQRQHTNLSSALRLFVLDFYRSQASGDEPDDQMPETTVRPALGGFLRRAAIRHESLRSQLLLCLRPLGFSSFAPAPVHGAIGYRGASDTERTRDSRIGKPLIEQRTHSSLERFAKADRVLAQILNRFRLQKRGRGASWCQMSAFEESVSAGQLSGLGFTLVGPSRTCHRCRRCQSTRPG
jgi:predicted DNA-binding ribbon-helix-helix protein